MKIKKLLTVILTAAILLSTACADNSTSQGGQSNVVGDTSGGVTESTGGVIVENTPNKVDDKLPQCEPANLPVASAGECIMKGKDGYYYTTLKITGESTATLALYYYDTASEKSIPLCSKPQCMHDGNDFCVATGGGTHMLYDSVAVMYNGYIYRLGNNAEETDKWTLSLLRADLQGNEQSKVADIFTVPLSEEIRITPQIRSAVLHYGKLFVAVAVLKEKWETDLYAVDLSSGDIKEINIAPPEKGTKEWGDSTCQYMTADGDWLYYTMRCCKFRDMKLQTESNMTYNRTVMYRYNIKTGVTEKISALPDVYSSFTVADGIIYYTVADRRENTISLYSYDIAKDKTTTFADKLQQKCVDGKYIEHHNKVTVVTDKKYLYVCTRGLQGYYSKENDDGTSDDIDFYIYDLEGNQLLHGMPGIDMTLDDYSYGLSAVDGELYFYYCDYVYDDKDLTGMYRIKTEDLINGSTDWKKLYTAMR